MMQWNKKQTHVTLTMVASSQGRQVSGRNDSIRLLAKQQLMMASASTHTGQYRKGTMNAQAQTTAATAVRLIKDAIDNCIIWRH